MKRGLTVLSILALAAIASLYYFLGRGTQTPPGQPALLSLNAENFSTLKTQFNDARDSVRVILLLSPT